MTSVGNDAMTCARFEARLPAFVDGTLPSGDRRVAEEHLARCPRCLELHAVLRSEPAAPPIDAPDGLVATILEHTSGSTCGPARQRLVDYVDGALRGFDHELVRDHVEHCPNCAATAAALARLVNELPAFAELEPPAELVANVLAATRPRVAWWRSLVAALQRVDRLLGQAPTRVDRLLGQAPTRVDRLLAQAPTRVDRLLAQAPTRVDRLLAQAPTRVERLLVRPRIAWEAGYIGAVVLWLVFGVSWSPLRAAPVEALAALSSVQQGPVARLAGAGGLAWDATGGRLLDSARAARSAVGQRYTRIAARLPEFAADGEGRETGILDRSVRGAGTMRWLSDRAERIRRQLASPTTGEQPE